MEMWRIRLFVKESVEKFWIWIAWKLPRKLTYWTSLRLMVFAWAHPGNETPDEISIMDALKRWEVKDD